MNKKIILTLGLLMASWSAWAAPFQAISAYSPDGIHVGVCFNQAVDTGNDLFNYSDGNAGGGVVETHVRTNTAAFPNKNKTVILTLNHAVGGPFTVTFSSVANAAQTETFSGSLPVDVGSFTSADIGCNALGESFSCSSGEFEIEAGGWDVWDDTQAKFLYEARSGDFDVIVQ